MSLSLFSSFFRQNCTGYQINETRSKVVFLFMLVIRVEVAKTDTSFLKCSSFSRFRTVPCKIPLLIIVVIDSLAFIFSISTITCPNRGISYIDISSRRARVTLSLRLAVVPLLFPFSFLVGSSAGGSRNLVVLVLKMAGVF